MTNIKTIWIDADACPKMIKDILFRAAIRTKTPLIAVANHLIAIPVSPYIKRVQVNSGFDVADNYIVENVKPTDIVITADIPLADAVVTQGAIALNPRGETYTKDNIKQHLATRNFNESLRSNLMISGGPGKLTPKELRLFANALDKFLVC